MTIAAQLDQFATDLMAMLAAGADADLRGMTGLELLNDLAAVERVGRVVDAARVRYAGEVGAFAARVG